MSPIRDWTLRLRALFSPRRVERELDDELASHIAHETHKLVARGMSPEDARQRALARFGPVALVADECRDARGTAFVETSTRDLHSAWRLIRRAPLASAAIVGTVALGLAMIAVVFTFYNTLFLQRDAVSNLSELHTVRRPMSPRAEVWTAFTRRDLEAMRRETSVFSDAFGVMLDGTPARIDGRATYGTAVTGTFFQVLGTGAALGRTLQSEDDRDGRTVMVLSHRGWTRLFARDPGVIGRRVSVNGAAFDIVGVMPPAFHGLRSTAPDYWAPLSTLGQINPASAGKEDTAEIEVVGRLKPGVSPASATAALTAWVAANPEFKPDGQFQKTAVLLPGDPFKADVLRGLLVFAPVFFAFGLILLIGCANVANLLLARGVARQREIGIRLSLGASRTRIIRQLLTESLLLSLMAAVTGLAVLRLALEVAVRAAAGSLGAAVGDRITFDVPAIDWRVLVFLVAGAIVSTVFFGLAPAVQATRLELVRTLRGEVMRDARPRRARGVLIAVQVGASALLLIAAAVFLRSAAAAASASHGIRTSDTVTIEITNEPLRPAVVQAVLGDPAVAMVAASNPRPQGPPGRVDMTSPSIAAAAGPSAAPYKQVSPEYFDVLGIEILSGRGFTALERTSSAGVAILSESTARRLWPAGDAVGQVVSMSSAYAPGRSSETPVDFTAGTFTIVGVVRDVRDEATALGLAPFTDAGVYLPASADMRDAWLTVRVHGDSEQARRGLTERLTKVDPAIGAITALKTVAGMTSSLLRLIFWMTVVLGGLALALTLSGIFSVLSYIVEQRREDIGIRLALGATARQIIAGVLAQHARPVIIGLVAGTGLAGAVAAGIMSTSAARVAHAVHVLDPIAYGASLVVVMTACLLAGLIPAVRAARIDPLSSLKRD